MGKIYKVGPKLAQQPEAETIAAFNTVITEIGGKIRRVPASNFLSSDHYLGKADLNTIPDTSDIGNWYVCALTATFTAFGDIAAHIYGRLYWNGATWDYYDNPATISVERAISFPDILTNVIRDYYESSTKINLMLMEDIDSVQYSTDNVTFNDITFPLTVQGTVYWKVTFSNGATMAFLKIKGELA